MNTNNPQPKSPAESKIEMTELVLPNDANVLGNALGGRVMHWIDLAAATSAHKHCGSICVTASLERLSFLNPIKVGQLAHLKARVVCTGNTSLITKVDVYAEDMDTGEKKLTSEAYLTFVCIDSNGKPKKVPPVKLESEDEKAECAHAREMRSKYKNTKG